MKRVCAWCKKVIKDEDDPLSKGNITHGMCSQCFIETTSFNPRTAKQILEYVQEPIFVIDSNGTIKSANKSGQLLVGKEYEEIENALGGDAFECSYASLGSGCGKTEHCKTCAIRNIVMDTLNAGFGFKSVPAYQSIKTSSGTKIIRFLISTEKVGDKVLLKIDKVEE